MSLHQEYFQVRSDVARTSFPHQCPVECVCDMLQKKLLWTKFQSRSNVFVLIYLSSGNQKCWRPDFSIVARFWALKTSVLMDVCILYVLGNEKDCNRQWGIHDGVQGVYPPIWGLIENISVVCIKIFSWSEDLLVELFNCKPRF